MAHKLIIPQYITEVKLSESRRVKPWLYSERDKLPERLRSSRYIWKKGKLWDTQDEEVVAKNSRSAGNPRMLTIRGNEIYARMHERLRMKIVAGIKDDFRKHLDQLPEKLPTPLVVSMELFCPPSYCNWDLDNLWIYNKCLQDLLQDEGIIPNDSVQYITGSAGILYHPVANYEERMMIFTFQQDTRPIIKVHNMFNDVVSLPIEVEDFKDIKVLKAPQELYEIKPSHEIEPGKISVNSGSDQQILIGVGKKKILYGSVRKALGHVYSQCIQRNICPVVSMDFYNDYEKFFNEEIVDKCIQLYIYRENRGPIYSSTQNVRNQIQVDKH